MNKTGVADAKIICNITINRKRKVFHSWQFIQYKSQVSLYCGIPLYSQYHETIVKNSQV